MTPEQAQKMIQDHNPGFQEQQVFVQSALGMVISQDVKSPIDLPLYDNSAMDGFLIDSMDTQNATPQNPVRLKIIGCVKAGDDTEDLSLSFGETYRIMTGACLPKGGNAVIPVEDAVVEDDFLVVSRSVIHGKHIRFHGEELCAGDIVLKKGDILNPGSIGFLASMGIQKVYVYPKPKISLIVTGSELVEPGAVLRHGEIYDSNSAMIKAALEEMRIYPVYFKRLKDKPKAIEKVIDFALNVSDIVILMGGVSVGDYDFVKELAEKVGVKQVFWKVSQKPGKPIYFGVKENRLVFGLPGNPASVFTCFYEYVYPAIRSFMGYSNPYLRSESIELAHSIEADPNKTLFIKADVRRGIHTTAMPLKHQKSHMLSSLCYTNAFVVVPGSEKDLEKGQSATVHSLPYGLEV